MTEIVAKVPMSKYRVMRRIMLAYAQLPLALDLNERSPFRTLQRLVDETLLREGLLRSLYVEYCRDGQMDLQTRFEILSPASSNAREAEIMVRIEAANAEGEDFLKTISPRLHALHGYLRDLILDRAYEEANWTIEFFAENDDLRLRSLSLEHIYKLREAAQPYLDTRYDLENQNPTVATFRSAKLSGFVFSIRHRP